MTHLVASGLTVRHGEVTALDDAALEAQSGRFIAVTGESGSGKSTLLWALAGAIRFDGTVRLDDAPVAGHDDARDRGIVLMPQTGGLAAMLTAHENIAYPLIARGVPADEASRRSTDALEQVGLDGFGDHLADELSGGQQQRVALARLLASGGGVLLADDPTSALDPVNRTRTLDLLREAARSGAIVVMASHDPDAAQAADAEILMDEGRLTWRRGAPAPATGSTGCAE